MVNDSAHALQGTANRTIVAGGAHGRRVGFVASLVLWATLVLMVAPSLSLGSPVIGAAGAPPAPLLGAPSALGPSTVPAPSTVTPTPASTAVPGSNPRLDTPVNGPLVVAQNEQRLQAMGARLTGPSNQSASTGSGSSPSSAPAPAQPLPLSNIITGNVTGYVYLQGTTTAIQGASVTVYSNSGVICPAVNCSTVYTTANGSFGYGTNRLQGPVGNDYVQVSYNWNETNYSYLTVPAHTTVYVGIIYLTPDALAWGYVKSNTTTPSAVGGVTICGSSRDQVIQASPCATSQMNSSSGYFVVAFPPLPSILTLTPPLRYESTFVFVNGTPHFAGQSIQYLGTILITPLTLVKVELMDAARSTPGHPAGASIQGAALTACLATTNACETQGPFSYSTTVVAFALPGPTILKVYAIGYVFDQVFVGNVTQINIGQTDNIGDVFLVPLGTASVKVGITTNKTGYGSMWSTGGLWYGTVQSMQGYQAGVSVPGAWGSYNMTSTPTLTAGCQRLGVTATIPAFPGRNDIVTKPDSTPTCSPSPSWPIPTSFPVWGNETWYNGTPDANVALGWLNMTPGTYIYGHVYTQGQTFAPRNYTVTVQSVSAPQSFQSYPFTWTYVYSYSGSWSEENNGWACSGRSDPNTSFCVAAPPGDFVVQVSTPDNMPNNYTWGFAHNICCVGNSEVKGITLANVTLDQETSINLTAQGRVTGNVFRLGTNLGVAFGIVEACPAGAANLPGLACGQTVVEPNGSFSTWAPLGWDYVTTSAADYETNTAWAYVSGNSSTPISVGNLTLVPYAILYGWVRAPSGAPIYGATVKTCLLSTGSACGILGQGETNSEGYYNGTVAGGWLPWSSYEVQVSAPGYQTDWTYINASAGIASEVPTLTLIPVGYTGLQPTGGPGGTGPRTPTTSTQIWLTGYVVDNVTGFGITGAAVSACSATTGGCATFNFTTNAWGEYNETLPTGIYYLHVNAPGYLPVTRLVTVVGTGSYYVGIIHVDPLRWASGNVAFYPWNTAGTGNITVPEGYLSSTHNRMPLGPTASVQACNQALTFCGPSGPVSTSGNFTVLTPTGLYNVAELTLTGAAVSSTVQGGSTSNSSIFNTSGWNTPLAPMNSLVYPALTGYVRDASTFVPGTTTRGWLPDAFASVGVTTLGPSHATVNWQANGGGFIAFFIPPGPNTTSFYTSQSTMYSVVQIYQNNTTLEPGGNLTLTNLSVGHFGFIDFHVFDSVSNAPAGYLPVTAFYYDARNLTTYQSVADVNGAGLVNVTSMYGKGVKVNVGGSSDFNNTTFFTTVNQSATTIPSATSIIGEPGMIALDHWGWVRSAEVNNSTGNGRATVIDQVKQLPLPGVLIKVASTDPNYGSGQSQGTSWFGQFVSDAPVGKYDVLTASRAAYVQNETHIAIGPDQVQVFSTINMTGDGVVAGKVVGLPTDTPVQAATVQLCVPKLACYTVATNSSGVFWVLAPPGTDTVTVTAPNYVSNSSVPVNVASDVWTWLGTVQLAQYAYAAGTVRALPSGFPIVNANVSLCSPLGTPTGPCGFSNLTTSAGSFLVEAPSGTYVLAASAPGFNASYRPMALRPGQHAEVGTIFLEQYGSLRGFVYSASTLTPVVGAQVLACGRWAGANCSAPATTDSLGSFSVSGPPGPYVISVSAPGYADGYQYGTIVTGGLTTVLPTLLAPLGVDESFAVSGAVVNASNPSQGLPGAIVSVSVGSAVSFSTSTGAGGAFSFQVVWGTYTLRASAPGYQPFSRPLVVNAPINALNLALNVMLFNVTGTVTDGLNGQPLSGVSLMEGSNLLGVTQSDGTFTVALANGTHNLSAVYQGPLSIPYAPVSFLISVNGANQAHNIALVPTTLLIKGAVVDALSGLPIANVLVAVHGIAVDGVPIAQTVTTDAGGTFSVTLPAGSYNASAAYPGYAAKVVNFVAQPPGAPITLALSPTGSSAASAGVPNELPLWIALGVVVAGVGLLSLLVLRRRRAPPAPGAAAPRRTGPSPGGRR